MGEKNNDHYLHPRGVNGYVKMSGMSIIVKAITRLIVGIIFLYGIYIILHGHISPGGGFAGGVIISGAFVLLVLAEGSHEARSELRKNAATIGESIGILIFFVLAVTGLFFGNFILNFLIKGKPLQLFSAGIIPLCNIGIGIEVASALFAVFITLAILKNKD